MRPVDSGGAVQYPFRQEHRQQDVPHVRGAYQEALLAHCHVAQLPLHHSVPVLGQPLNLEAPLACCHHHGLPLQGGEVPLGPQKQLHCVPSSTPGCSASPSLSGPAPCWGRGRVSKTIFTFQAG